MTKRLHLLLVGYRTHSLLSLGLLLISLGLLSFTSNQNELKWLTHYVATSPPIRKSVLHAYDADPIKFTLQADKQTAALGEKITVTITAHYLNIPSTLLFTADGINGFRLKALLPEGFVQTGGDYIDYVGTILSAATPTTTYKLIGHFEKPSDKTEFRLLRSSYYADANSLFVEKARLSILVTSIDRSSSGKVQARSTNCNYYEGQYLLNNGTEAMYAHYYNGRLYAGYQDGSNFRPQHWLIATGQMTVEQASCFAEDDPRNGSSNPTNPPSSTCSYAEGQYLFTFGTEAMYAHYYNGVLFAAYQDGGNFRPQHWLIATGLMTPTIAGCFAENDPHATTSLPINPPTPTNSNGNCSYTEGQYLFTFGTEAMYAHYYNGILYAAYQDGTNFRPQHWLGATGLMTPTIASCFAENDPHTTTPPTPTPPTPSTPTSTCGYSEGQYLFTFGTEAMYAHYYNGVLYAAYQDGTNFRPQHWLIATGLMTPSIASCFAENDPHNSSPNPTTSAQPSNGNCGTGSGLTGLYSNSLDLSKNLVAIRNDAQINFNWNDSPLPGTVNADGFSVRWFGQIEAPVSGNYTFKTNNDDGTRLWVNGQQLIEDWNGHGPTWQQGSIYLTAGQKYDIILDYFDLWGGAQAQLYWEYSGQSLQLVPTCRLYSNNQTIAYSGPSSSDRKIPVCSISIGYVTYYTQCGSGIVIDYDDNTPTSTEQGPTGSAGGVYIPIGGPRGVGGPIDPNIYVPGGSTNPIVPILRPVGAPAPTATQTALSNFYISMQAKGIFFTYDEKAVIDEYPDVLINRISTFVAQFGTKPDGRNAFILSLADQQRYPKFTTLVRSLQSFVANDRKVREAIMHFTGYSEKKLLALLEFGQGPHILIQDVKSQYGSKARGHCTCPGFPDWTVEIEISFVKGLEQANLKSTQQATAFLLAITMLHEFTHWGAAQNNVSESGYEFGDSMEIMAFGTTITKNNAGSYDYRFFEK